MTYKTYDGTELPPDGWAWGGDVNDDDYAFWIRGVRDTTCKYLGPTINDAVATAKLLGSAPRLIERIRALAAALRDIGDQTQCIRQHGFCAKCHAYAALEVAGLPVPEYSES